MADQSSKKKKSDGGIDWQTLHLWQIQPVRDVLLVLAIFAILSFGKLISVVTVPMLLALLLAYLFEPLVRRLERVSWMSRQGATVSIIVAVIALIVVPVSIGVTFAVVNGVGFAGRFAQNVAQVADAIEAAESGDRSQVDALPEDGWGWIARYVAEEDDADREGADDGIRAVIDFASTWAAANREAIGRQALITGRDAIQAALRTFSSLGVLTFSAFLTVFFFFFFSTGYASVVEFGKQFLPEKHKDRIIDLVSKMDGVIAAFIRGRLTIAFLQSIVFSIAYWLIGVPTPLLLGIIVAILSIVPYMALIGLPVSMLLLWLEPSSIAWQQNWWWIVGAPVFVYFFVQALDDYLWTPMIQGKGTDMDTPSIVAASVGGGAIAGVYGLLLAIPVAACGKILIKELVWPRIQQWRSGEVSDPLPIAKTDG